VDFRGEERPVAVLTREGRAVMKGERPARVLLPREEPTRRTTPPAAASPVGLPAAACDASAAGMPAAVAGGRGGADLDEGAARLFEQLRAYRLRAAREESVPPYVIASDRTLRDIAVLRPRTIDEFLLAHGIGETKARRYGRAILEVVAGASGPEEARS